MKNTSSTKIFDEKEVIDFFLENVGQDDLFDYIFFQVIDEDFDMFLQSFLENNVSNFVDVYNSFCDDYVETHEEDVNDLYLSKDGFNSNLISYIIVEDMFRELDLHLSFFKSYFFDYIKLPPEDICSLFLDFDIVKQISYKDNQFFLVVN